MISLEEMNILLLQCLNHNICLKVLTNEKRGGLALLQLDRSRFKLFSRKFSNKLVQAPSCERPITALRALLLSFAINNCFPKSDEKLLALFELVLGDFVMVVNHVLGTAANVESIILFVWQIFQGPSPIIAMTLTKVTTAMLPISVRYLCRNSKRCMDC